MVDVDDDTVLVSLSESLRILQRVVGCSEGTAMAMDPEVLLPVQFVATFPGDPELALRACRNEQQDVDVFKFVDLAAATDHVATLSVDHDAACASSPRWQELLLPRGRRHELRGVFVDAQGVCWGAFAVYRREQNRFSPADLRSVRDLLPGRAAHLAKSMVVSRTPGTPREPTSFLVDGAGAVLEAPDTALRWMEEMRGADLLDRVGMLLASLAARLRHRREAGRQLAPVRVRMRSAGGAWTTLIAEPLRGAGTRETTSVVVMAADATQLFPLQLAAFGLSDREDQVIRLVLGGLDTKAIAARLSISALTVQDHLKSVFEKTGVHSRRELARLFLDAPTPA